MFHKYAPCTIKIIQNGKFIGYKNRRYILDSNNDLILKDNILERHYIPNNETVNEINSIFLTNENENENEKNNLITRNLNLNKVFIFTESYGDRNICHWLTEQLMILNYLIDLLREDKNIHVIINKNRRQSMNSIIIDYLYAIPELNTENIIEIDFNGDENILIRGNNIYLGNAIYCNLSNIYQNWNNLHSRLDFNLIKSRRNILDNSYSSNNNTGNSDNISDDNKIKYSKNIYMSRRNIYKPGKNTNTRILENCDEISNIILNKGYQEVFTDELKDLEERNTLFSNIDNIVCELGAGMHNLLFCKDGINIIVLYQKNNISWLQEYYPLFKMKKFNVRIITGETTSHKHNGNWLNTPWRLNPSDVEKIL